jgi:hypothetical protein
MNAERYRAIHIIVSQAYKDCDWDYYNTLHRELALAYNARLAYEGFIHEDERPMTIAQDVALGIISHIEGDYTNCLDAVY